MKIIYEPKGAAKEYSELAVNLYTGCEHGCKYCYAPSCRFKTKEEYFSNQYIRKDVLNLLEKDLQEMSRNEDKRRVLFCFICDPYQKDESFNAITREALLLFKKYNISFQVLTKGGIKATRDFDLYKNKDAFAVTLTFLDKNKSLEWEPNAALPSERIESLKIAYSKGIETWVSFEPVIECEECFKLIDETYKFVDLYKIGKINHYKDAPKQDWEKFTKEVIAKLEKLGKKYYIKDSLKKYL